MEPRTGMVLWSSEATTTCWWALSGYAKHLISVQQLYRPQCNLLDHDKQPNLNRYLLSSLQVVLLLQYFKH